MSLRDPLTDGEPKPESAALRHSRPNPVGAPEALEDVRHIGGSYPDAGISHGKGHVVGVTSYAQLDLAAGRRVLDGVGDEVQEQLAQARPVSHNDDVGCKRQVDGDSLRFSKDQRGLVDLLYQRLQLYRLPEDVEPSLIEACESEETLDEVSHSAHFLERFLECDHPLGLARRHHGPLHVRA